jgi:hypothetical protein
LLKFTLFEPTFIIEFSPSNYTLIGALQVMMS